VDFSEYLDDRLCDVGLITSPEQYYRDSDTWLLQSGIK